MFYIDRINKVKNYLSESKNDALLVEDVTNIYYLTGLDVSTGKIVISKNHANILLDNRYFEMAQKLSPIPVVLSEGEALRNLLLSPMFEAVETLAFESAVVSYDKYEELVKLSEKLDRKLNLVPAGNPVLKLREIKDENEITLLREAAALGSEGYDYVVSILKEGISEIEVAGELEIFWKRRGSKSLGFDPIIAFGANSSMPHYRAGQAKLKKGDTVLIDIGVNYKYYRSDMTRVVFYGTPHPKILEIYDVVLQAQSAALAIAKPGTTIGALDDAARKYIDSKGFGPNFTHNLGHGVGLDIHEMPTLRNKPPFNDIPLTEGMVITIEPGIYLPDIGGVRIEDTVAITNSGHINLTNRSKDVLVINC